MERDLSVECIPVALISNYHITQHNVHHSVLNTLYSKYRMSEKDCTFFKNFIYQKLGNKSKFFSTLQRFNMGALRDTADI